MTKPREEFEKARNENAHKTAMLYYQDSANENGIEWVKGRSGYQVQVIDHKNTATWAYDYRQAEIDRKDEIIERLKKTFERIENGEYITNPDSNFAARLCDIREEVTQVLDDVAKMEAGDE